MLKIKTNKIYLQMVFLGLVMILFIFPIKKESYAAPASKPVPVADESQTTPAPKESKDPVPAPEETKGEPEDTVQVIVEDKPLDIPKKFKKTLKAKGISGFMMVYGEGQISLVSVDGRYVNPCQTKTAASVGLSADHGASHPCRFEAKLSELTMLFAAGRACGTCQANEVGRVCKKTSHKYGCVKQKNGCETSCQ
jgi:hypothetical protein